MASVGPVGLVLSVKFSDNLRQVCCDLAAYSSGSPEGISDRQKRSVP